MRSHDVPGTVAVHGRVVNLHEQLLLGKPVDDAPPGAWPGTERFVTRAQATEANQFARFRWFAAGLWVLPRALPTNKAASLAVPATSAAVSQAPSGRSSSVG